MKFIPVSMAVNTLCIASFSLMSWNTPPSEEAPKLRDETFIPVLPISRYCIFKVFMGF
ncbi:hypothetical protein SDC9_194165 [bioreactor metagenome]|uniref:Uncharacterized protein n=1 Tax=bioreactor metagenome TaxID=1076179 RepID=A0A645IE56_9ZZZZ